LPPGDAHISSTRSSICGASAMHGMNDEALWMM
jgi:hypothetical protein